MIDRTIRCRIARAVRSARRSAVARRRRRAPPPQPSTTQMVLKGKAPVSNEVLKVKLPRPQEADLPNGLHLMVLEDHRLPQVTFRSSFRAPAATTIRPTRSASPATRRR